MVATNAATRRKKGKPVPTYIVRIHFAIEAPSAEIARARLIEAQESCAEIEGLDTSCVDNLDEITTDGRD